MARTRYPSNRASPDALYEPLEFTFSGRTASNRLMKAALTEYMASWDADDRASCGVPSEELITLYKCWGEGDWGMVVTGNIMVDGDHLESPGNMIVSLDMQPSGERFDRHRRMATEAKRHGSLFVGQISHPGRQVRSEIQEFPISASALQLTNAVTKGSFNVPRAASEHEIAHVVASFQHCAYYLYRAGYDGVQLHGAHGYLLAQFLSLSTNIRQDSFGGSLENRARLVCLIVEAIRKVCPRDFIIGIKINSVEWQERGFSPEEAGKLVQILEDAGMDFIELSGGTYERFVWTHERDGGHSRESTSLREAFFLEFANTIAPMAKQTRVYLTGGFRTVQGMTETAEVVDGIGIGRGSAEEPHLPRIIRDEGVQALISQLLDQEQFLLTSAFCGAQMRQLSRSESSMKGDAKDDIEIFMQALQKHVERRAQAGKHTYGHVDVRLILS